MERRLLLNCSSAVQMGNISVRMQTIKYEKLQDKIGLKIITSKMFSSPNFTNTKLTNKSFSVYAGPARYSLTTLKRILCYFKHSISHGLLIWPCKNFQLVAFSDVQMIGNQLLVMYFSWEKSLV